MAPVPGPPLDPSVSGAGGGALGVPGAGGGISAGSRITSFGSIPNELTIFLIHGIGLMNAANGVISFKPEIICARSRATSTRNCESGLALNAQRAAMVSLFHDIMD